MPYCIKRIPCIGKEIMRRMTLKHRLRAPGPSRFLEKRYAAFWEGGLDWAMPGRSFLACPVILKFYLSLAKEWEARENKVD
jgi:hypothetical protein